MMDEATTKSIINVQYNIPRFVIGSPGKQNRACTGEMRIVPGVANPFEFQYANTDGVPINLNGFKLLLFFWFTQNEYETLGANMQSNVILAKYLYVDDPYAGKATALLTDQDTLAVAAKGRSSIRWSVYLIDKNTGSSFATQITSAGEPYGIAHIAHSDIPNAETIKGISIKK